MAELYVRNCAIPSALVPSDVRYRTMGRRETWLIWECLRLAGWSEQWKDADAAWTASERFSPVADGAVLAANPLRITSATAQFLSNGVLDGDVISVEGTLGQNLGMYRIVEIPDNSTVIIDQECAPGEGWTDESGMTIKVTTCATKSGEQLADTVEVCMTPPSGTQQVRFGGNIYRLDVTTYPKGDVTTKGTGTPTATSSINRANYADKPRVNCYVNDQNAFFYNIWEDSGSHRWSTLLFGELEVDGSDAYPGFYAQGYDTVGLHDAFDLFTNTSGWLRQLFMLDPTATSPQTFATAYLKRYGGVADAQRREALFNCRLLEGGSSRRKPEVWTSPGASPVFRRGKIQHVRSTYNGWERMRPYDPAGQWVHLDAGLLVPRGSPNDPIIREVTDPNFY